MNELHGVLSNALLVGLGPVLLLLFVIAPRSWVNRQVGKMTVLASAATITTFLLAIGCAINEALTGRIEYSITVWKLLHLGVYFDTLSAVMLLLVSFLGAIVTRYACTYLKGDDQQGYFLKWLCVTIGAVLMIMISGNLLVFTAAWMGTSLSLHKLLTFYPHRRPAMVAARQKFIISRLGDACLIGAIVLIYQAFGTLQLSDLFARAEALHAGGALPPQLTLICLLLAAGAMMKSAQFPFHSWLPDTMETPTPVSALMHAGIINGGGYLIVRLAPLVSLSPIALNSLAIVGAFTALLASLILMTQASIKRMLAFSTIAQMGFMMLQCGLGAFSIAVLHIVAHSLYKAHAFLSSGNVVEISKSSWVPEERPGAHPTIMMLSLVGAVALTLVAAFVMGFTQLEEPGVILLGMIFVMGLGHLLWTLWGQSLSPRLLGSGLLLGAVVSVTYIGLHLGFKSLLVSTLPHEISLHDNSALTIAIIALFGAVLVLQEQLPLWGSTLWCRRLYVHARNGFYFNTLANRAIQKIWSVR